MPIEQREIAPVLKGIALASLIGFILWMLLALQLCSN